MRILRAGWACALALVLASCQDYNFNPVGHCVIQPGTKRVTLSNISSADVLFVVDDSGSMGGEQTKLGTNFDSFITNLDNANAARATAGLQPFDFHIAVTTTSVFWNYQTGTTCSASCTGATSPLVCCKTDGTPAKAPKSCTPGVTTCPSGTYNGTPWTTTCGTNCAGFKGSNYCCDQSTGSFPVGSTTEQIPCDRAGTMCGTLETHYDFAGCTDGGVGVDQWPYPQGDFVSWASGSSANPRVLHFDKELYTSGKNKQGFTRSDLISFFAGGTYGGASVNGNVMVGTCGSGEEQALHAAWLAVQKAVSTDSNVRQKDTYARTSTTPQQTWTARTATGGGGAAGSVADFLAPGASSKLVLVFVGDEDDCSSKIDPSGGVVMLAEAAGADACTRDATTPAPLGQKEYAVDFLADQFAGLGRPLGAAFIFPAAQTSCSGDACTPGLCCDTLCTGSVNVCSNATCGAQAPGVRLAAAASALRNRGADVVMGSICDPTFASILDSIADLVKPPTGLTLPSLPAADEVTLLRIAYPDGQTRKVCGNPLAPGSYPTLADAQATGADWWFTATPDVITQAGAWNPVAVSQFVYINPLGACIANPGETYSADYLGQMPAGGCWNDASYTPQTGETAGDAMCRTILGGAAGSWTCYAGVNDAQACVAPTQAAPGTCICGKPAANCPGGRLP